MTTIPIYTQVASQMIPSSVNYGDTVFIVMPLIPTGKQIAYGSGDGKHVSMGSPTSITSGDPYIIDPVTGPQNPPPTTPVSVTNNSLIRLRRVNDPNQSVWYNASGDDKVQIAQANPNDNRATWIINLYQSSSSTGPITYGSAFTLTSKDSNQYVNFESSWPASTGNLKVDSNNVSLTIPEAAFTFLYGPLSTAQLQCCTNNPIYTGFCGDYQGNTYSGSCDTILTNYCQSITLGDPNCGCLLPSSYYSGNSTYGPPECIDNRCVDVPGAYMTSQQHTEQCDITNCNISPSQIYSDNISQAAINKYCGSQNNGGTPSTPGTPPSIPPSVPPSTSITTNPWFWGVIGIVVLFLVIIIIVVLMSSGKKSRTKK